MIHSLEACRHLSAAAGQVWAAAAAWHCQACAGEKHQTSDVVRIEQDKHLTLGSLVLRARVMQTLQPCRRLVRAAEHLCRIICVAVPSICSKGHPS